MLALVRDADYAHAGEEEAIQMALRKFEDGPRSAALDLGCGRGGTADQIRRAGWQRVTGADIDAQSVDYARNTYPDVEFLVCDASDLSSSLPLGEFDTITMFNVFYALECQGKVARECRRVARDGATLAIFDYVDRGGFRTSPEARHGVEELPYPMSIPETPECLGAAGWHVEDIVDLDEHYLRWYERFVKRIEERKAPIVKVAGEPGYARVHAYYSNLREALG